MHAFEHVFVVFLSFVFLLCDSVFFFKGLNFDIAKKVRDTTYLNRFNLPDIFMLCVCMISSCDFRLSPEFVISNT